MRYTRIALATGCRPAPIPVAMVPIPVDTRSGQASHGCIYQLQILIIVKAGLSFPILTVRQLVNHDTELRTRHTNASADVGYSS